MEGFPNQVSDFRTLAAALKVLADLVQGGTNAGDDGVLGEELIRRRVLGTGHKPIPVEEYLNAQKAKPRASDQSYRTRARGLRELFRIMRLVDDGAPELELTPAGRRIAGLPENGRNSEALELWRTVVLQMTHKGGDSVASHPYQVLLRLVARRPGITRAKCPLALEAKDDSEQELERIVELAGLDEAEIRASLGVTKPNWNNAKKILPSFAEQLGDVVKVGNAFYLGDVPGEAKESRADLEKVEPRGGARRPRKASAVTAASIAKSTAVERWDEVDAPEHLDIDPQAVMARRRRLNSRLKRHNDLVRKVAVQLEREGGQLFENPFDCLACFREEGLLLEVKSLDGTQEDERSRVREALGQLLYYESFVTKPVVSKRAVRKVACFEAQIGLDHVHWLEEADIYVIWDTASGFGASPKARSELAGHFGF
jgi:hypothetical protein